MKDTIRLNSATLAAVATWTSEDWDRPHLRMVLFTKGEYVATDGHRMVIVPVKYDGEPFGVDRANILGAVPAQQALRGGLGDMEIAFNGKNKVKIAISSGAEFYVPAADASAYPPYRKTLETSNKKGSRGPEGHSFNPKYLAAIHEIQKTINADRTDVRITGWGDDKQSPMVFENTSGVRFLVMPTMPWPDDGGRKARR